MNDENLSADSSNELSGILRTAVEELKREPIPEAAMQQALGRAARRMTPAARTNRRARRHAALGLAAAIAACIVLVVWYSRPTDLWAQVVKAVQAKPWVHGVSRQDGKTIFESWQSMSGAIVAWRSEKSTGFTDERSKITFEYSYQYEPKPKALYRRRSSSFDREMPGTGGVEFFQAILHGDSKLKSPLPDSIVKDQHHRQIKQDGRDWDEYELVLQNQRRQKLETWKILVDPQTYLPRSVTIDYNPQKITTDFDYPDSGPANIYALGVPKDAKMWDCIPTGEAARTIAAIQSERDRFDDYLAIVVREASWGATSERTTFLVWKNGTRWRVEQAHDFPKTMPGAAIKDVGRWLRGECTKAAFSPFFLSDGTSEYDHFGNDFKREDDPGASTGPGPQPGQAMPDYWAYHNFGPVQYGVYLLNKKPTGGPSGSILLTISAPDWPATAFWLDPNRNFASLRSEIFVGSSTGPQSWRAIMDSWRQTPKGIWYPTQVTDNFFMKTDRFHFFLEFGTEIPDSLFKPEKRTVFLDRYPVK